MDQAAPRCQDLLHSGAVLGSPLRWGQAGFPVPPRSQSGTKAPPTVSRVSRSCPKCGDRGQPSCVIKLMWVCPAGHWGGQCGDAPSPHPQEMWGSLPPLETCACGLVGFF